MSSSNKVRAPRPRKPRPPASTTLNGNPVKRQFSLGPTNEASAKPLPENGTDANEDQAIEALREGLEAMERLKIFQEARNDFLLYCKLMMPSPDDPDDLSATMYEVAKHHRVLAAAL